tara:strand:+ start:80 stop:1024 length:945 start_codon:yes stop_codon:yes gene_type:complete
MKRFIKYILCLLVLPFLVFFINTKTGIHSEEFNQQFVTDLILNDSLKLNINLNDRQMVKSRINYKVKFKKNIVLGSSRSFLIGKPINLEVENYSLAGAIIDDFENIYFHLKNKNIQIDTVFLEISPWIFNENTDESRYKDFNTPSLNRKIKKLFSVRYLIDNLHPNKYSQARNEKDFIRYSDGTIRYDSEYRNQDNLKSIKNYIKKTDIYHLEKFNLLKNLNSNRLVSLIERMIKDGVFPVLIKHPYPPLINNKILEKYPNVMLTEKIIDSLIIKYNLKSFGAFEPEQLNLSNNDYYDGMHLTPNGIKKLLELD